ncbi:MAG: hypothetical protein V4556_12255 [Bacteroidota bacterium]
MRHTEIHGNRKNATDALTYELKKIRQNNNYRIEREKMAAFTKVNSILKHFLDTYGSIEIPVDLLDAAGLDWDLSVGKKQVGGIWVTIVGKYGYTIFKNETIRICIIL